MKVRVNKILEFCKTAQELTGEENPEVTYDAVMKALFPLQWKLDNYYLHRRPCSDEDDDPDCYSE
jgi:hypothetical protein